MAFSDSASLTERGKKIQSIRHFPVLIVRVSFVCLLEGLAFCFSFSLYFLIAYYIKVWVFLMNK